MVKKKLVDHIPLDDMRNMRIAIKGTIELAQSMGEELPVRLIPRVRRFQKSYEGVQKLYICVEDLYETRQKLEEVLQEEGYENIKEDPFPEGKWKERIREATMLTPHIVMIYTWGMEQPEFRDHWSMPFVHRAAIELPVGLRSHCILGLESEDSLKITYPRSRHLSIVDVSAESGLSDIAFYEYVKWYEKYVVKPKN